MGWRNCNGAIKSQRPWRDHRANLVARFLRGFLNRMSSFACRRRTAFRKCGEPFASLGRDDCLSLSATFRPPDTTSSCLPLASQACEPCPYSANECEFVTIISVGYERTDVYYDFTVERYHNYFMAGIVHHNSGKSIMGMLTIHERVRGPNGRWRKPQGPEWYILGRDQVKFMPARSGLGNKRLGFGRRVFDAGSSRKFLIDVQDENGNRKHVVARRWVCPSCGKPIVDKNGAPINVPGSSKLMTCDGKFAREIPEPDPRPGCRKQSRQRHLPNKTPDPFVDPFVDPK